jgi:hypothetical protein
MALNLEDYYVLLHPALAIVVGFPMLGLIVRLAWQTRIRRQRFSGNSSKLAEGFYWQMRLYA